jgi:hypothetical protein
MDGYEPLQIEMGCEAALRQTKNGFKARREDWTQEEYLIWADTGQFRKQKVIMGDLEPFLVKHTAGNKFKVYIPTGEDLAAQDWTVSL